MHGTQPRIDFRLRRDGSWAIAAWDKAGSRLTLVEGTSSGAARVVVLTPDDCTEALSGTMGTRRGIGHARTVARLSRKGGLAARLDRIYPGGTFRSDEVTRSGEGGSSRSRFTLPSGRFAEVSQKGAERLITLSSRQGKPIFQRRAQLLAPRKGLVTGEISLVGRDGNAGGSRFSTLQILPSGGESRVTHERTLTGEDGSVTRSVWGLIASGNGVQGVSSTVHADGSTSGSSWVNYGDHGSSTDYHTSADGSLEHSTQTGWNTSGGHSASSTTSVTKSGNDTFTSTGQSWKGEDGSINLVGETRDQDGRLVGRTSIVDKGDVVSTTRIEYDDHGGGVIVTTTTDRNSGETSTTVSQFDKNGNPPAGDGTTGPHGDDGPPEGDDGPPEGGDDDGDHGGGDEGGEVPADDGSGGDDMGPGFHFGGPRRAGGIGDFGSLLPTGPYGGGDGTEGDGDGVGPADFIRIAGGLLGAAGGTFGGSEGADGWGGGGPDDGAREPVIHYTGEKTDHDISGHGLATDDWGDLNDPRMLTAFAAASFGVGGAGLGQTAALAMQFKG